MNWSLLTVWATARSSWRQIVAAAVLCGIAAAAVAKLRQPYRVVTLVQSRGQARAGASALAASLGLDLSSTGDSPQFLVEMTKFDDVLRATANANYPSREGADSVKLAARLGFKNSGPVQEARATRWLAQNVTATADRRTGIVTVVVENRDPKLAFAVARHLLESLQLFDLSRRQSRAGQERVFIARRLKEVQREVDEAEGNLRRFLENNRSLSSSPLLQLERERLTRVVSVKQAVLISLLQALEQARVEELRDLPTLTTLQAPRFPVEPASSGMLRYAAIGVIVGMALSVTHVMLRTRQS